VCCKTLSIYKDKGIGFAYTSFTRVCTVKRPVILNQEIFPITSLTNPKQGILMISGTHLKNGTVKSFMKKRRKYETTEHTEEFSVVLPLE